MVKKVPIVERLAVIAGFGLMVWGTWMLSPPASAILAGLLLMAGALVRSRA